jgi:hypothetical protein
MVAIAMLFASTGLAMSQKVDSCNEGEDISMLLRRTLHQETISSDIALRLAEMVFTRVYGKEYTDERSPLVVVDGGDRWEVRSREGIEPLERLSMVIAKSNGRILSLVNF